MTLIWKSSEPRPDAFEAAVGDNFKYVVHLAVSTAQSDEEIQADLSEAVFKALPFARAATGERAKIFLLLWDAVFCNLTIVCTDESMMYDSPQVVRCDIRSLEARVYAIDVDDSDTFEREISAISNNIQQMLINILNGIDQEDLPSDKPILFSDQDRASVGAGFIAKPLD